MKNYFYVICRQKYCDYFDFENILQVSKDGDFNYTIEAKLSIYDCDMIDFDCEKLQFYDFNCDKIGVSTVQICKLINSMQLMNYSLKHCVIQSLCNFDDIPQIITGFIEVSKNLSDELRNFNK